MIKVELGKCIEPFNRFFKKGELYLIVPIKGNQGCKAAYISPSEGFPIIQPRMSYFRGEYHHTFFEPIQTLFFHDYNDLKEFKKSIFRYNCVHVSDFMKEKWDTKLLLLPKKETDVIKVTFEK